MLLYVSNPAQSRLSALALQGSFSGYKGNISKSELFPVNEAARNLDFNSFTLKVEHSRFTYLGVTVTQKYKDLFKENSAVYLNQIKLIIRQCKKISFIP
uniref:Uncharacterized protein n=1 Tax=Oryzias latipes TaxID=8090 RepID=A0A3P9L5Z7_ORYLA